MRRIMAPTGALVAVVVLLAGAMLWTSSARKKTMAEAQRALARHRMVGLNPPLLAAGLQVGQKIGWRQALPSLVALITASVALRPNGVGAVT
jgi:hypothetical protein